MKIELKNEHKRHFSPIPTSVRQVVIFFFSRIFHGRAKFKKHFPSNAQKTPLFSALSSML